MKKFVAFLGAAALLVVVLLLLPRGNGGQGGPSATTTAATTTTTAPTTTTTRAPVSSEAGQAANLLVNLPTDHAAVSSALADLQTLCNRYGNNISFYYKDLGTGNALEFRADRSYQAASVIKAPYVKHLLTLGVDGTEKLTLTSKMGGSTYVDKYPRGTQFTVDELMEYAIRYSDNTAYYMLNQRFGFTEFNEYADSLGISANSTNHCTLMLPKPRFGYLSARDIGLYFEDIAAYIAQGGADAARLKAWLTSTTETRLISAAYEDTYTVAHKYGDMDTILAFHDGAIVYGEHPFVLSVATSLQPFTDTSLEVIHEIARLVNVIHSANHTR